MVRSVACMLRGDESADILSFRKMPSISIDLPMTKHGYEVQANEVFWVEHSILRATDLRDSMDEQCIADVAACVVGGSLIDRSKVALDEICSEGSAEAIRVSNALTVYGTDKFAHTGPLSPAAPRGAATWAQTEVHELLPYFRRQGAKYFGRPSRETFHAKPPTFSFRLRCCAARLSDTQPCCRPCAIAADTELHR